jgi:AcrR family transcriptional regulator
MFRFEGERYGSLFHLSTGAGSRTLRPDPIPVSKPRKTPSADAPPTEAQRSEAQRPEAQRPDVQRTVRADAQRNLDALLEAAKGVFATSGVDAPVREIAAQAGVGVATVYRNFPQRADLVAAVFRREIDALAAAAGALAEGHARYTRFVATKRGLAAALHSGDPAFASMPAYFEQHVGPALAALIGDAAKAGDVRGDVDAMDVLRAVSNLCVASDEAHSQRMVLLLLDGLRFGATGAAATRAAAKAAAATKAITTRPGTAAATKPGTGATKRSRGK